MLVYYPNLLTREMPAMEVVNSKVVSRTSHMVSCMRLTIMGPKQTKAEPCKLSTSSAIFGERKCSTASWTSFKACTVH